MAASAGGKLMVLLLGGVVFVSAIGVVYSKHASRKLFVESQRLSDERDRLNTVWGQLQLEQSTWATDGRIERIARKRLGMHIPSPGEVVIVKP